MYKLHMIYSTAWLDNLTCNIQYKCLSLFHYFILISVWKKCTKEWVKKKRINEDEKWNKIEENVYIMF